MGEELVFGVLDRTGGQGEGRGGGEVLTGECGSGERLEPFEGLFGVP